MHNLDHFKRLSVGDRVDENVAMYADGVLGREEGVFILSVSSYIPCAYHHCALTAHLACRVNDLAVILSTAKSDRLVRGRLDGGVVGFLIGGRGNVLLDKGCLAYAHQLSKRVSDEVSIAERCTLLTDRGRTHNHHLSLQLSTRHAVLPTSRLTIRQVIPSTFCQDLLLVQ